MLRSLLLSASFATLLSVSPNLAAAQDAEKKAPIAIQESMNFTLNDAHGEEVNFKDLLGKGPLLVNFWALWCEPCKQEMKAFKGLVEKYQEKGVSMVAINTDGVRSLAKVRAYVTTHNIDVPVLSDPDGSIARDIFSMESLPFSIILMPDGTVYKKHIGYTAGDEMVVDREVGELLEKLESGK